MQFDGFTNTFAELDQLLDDERSALLQGDLEKISFLYERKEILIDYLSQLERGEYEELEALNAKVRRNQGLLDGALEGIRAVTKRLSELRRVRISLDTYDENGHRRSINIKDNTSVEKRA